MLTNLLRPAVAKESIVMIKLAIPAVIAQLAQMSLGAIDTIMAGNLSTNALAAIAVGNNLFVPMLIFSLGLFMALNPLVAQANGAKRYNKLGEYLRQGLYLAVVTTIPTLLLLDQLEPLMHIIGVQPSIIPVVMGYLEAISWGVLPLYLFLVVRSVNEGLFSTPAIMYISLAAIPVNILLNYIFMYGYLGLPAMGAIGLGYATSIVWTLLFLALFLYTIFAKKYQHIVFFSHFHKPDWKVFKEILHIGIPLSISVGLEVLMFGTVGLLIGRYSVEIIAAHQIAVNFSSLVFMVPLGLSVAVTARVGHAVGSNSVAAVKRASKIGLAFSASLMACAMILTMLFPLQLVSIYTSETEVREIAVQLLYLAAIFMISDGLQVTTAGALRGLKDTFVPMLMAGISYWLVGFPVGYFMAEVMEMEARGYWIGYIAGLSVAAILLGYRLRYVFRNLSLKGFKNTNPA